MPARQDPQTSIRNRRILECEPERRYRNGCGVEKTGILMPINGIADVRLFKDIHRLPNLRIEDTEIRRQPGKLCSVRERREDGVEIVHRMPDLINRERFVDAQVTGRIKCLAFEKAADSIRRTEKVVVNVIELIVRRKYRSMFVRVETCHNLLRALSQRCDLGLIFESLDNDETVVDVALFFYGAEHRYLSEPWRAVDREALLSRRINR